MRRRFVKAILASIAAATMSFAAAAPADAQEVVVTGPLKGQPAVRHLRLYRQGRFELAPTVSFTLLDEYRRTILAGGRLTYNIRDWVGIGVWGAAGAISTTTDLTDKINQTSPRDQLTAINVSPGNFADQTAKISYVVAPQLTFVPFRGKLAIFNKIFVDTDFYLAGGVGFVGIQERKDCGGTNALKCTDPASFDLQSKTKFSPTFGVGFTFYLTGFVSLGVEYRALPFSWNRAGFDSRGAGTNGNFPDGQVNSQDETFRFNQLVTIALGFSFPTAPKLNE